MPSAAETLATLTQTLIIRATEITAGEGISMQRGQRPEKPNAWYITGVKQASGLKAFEAELGWE